MGAGLSIPKCVFFNLSGKEAFGVKNGGVRGVLIKILKSKSLKFPPNSLIYSPPIVYIYDI
jgi:hypothetical protein